MSFASYAMASAHQPFALEFAEHLYWPRSTNADSRIGGVSVDVGQPNSWYVDLYLAKVFNKRSR